MRRILVDFARSRGYQKRGGGAKQVSFTEALEVAGGQATIRVEIVLEDLGHNQSRMSPCLTALWICI